MVTLHEVITFLVSMQISISSLQTHNVNRCGRSRHLARKLSLRRKRSSPNVFEMAATETITSIIPMLGFHKQMDNRIKLLEEILSFRMQGVEFDNGDMYVDGHKAASDVRDEFVSVTEKLMDELAQCYNVLPQL